MSWSFLSLFDMAHMLSKIDYRNSNPEIHRNSTMFLLDVAGVWPEYRLQFSRRNYVVPGSPWCMVKLLWLSGCRTEFQTPESMGGVCHLRESRAGLHVCHRRILRKAHGPSQGNEKQIGDDPDSYRIFFNHGFVTPLDCLIEVGGYHM